VRNLDLTQGIKAHEKSTTIDISGAFAIDGTNWDMDTHESVNSMLMYSVFKVWHTIFKGYIRIP